MSKHKYSIFYDDEIDSHLKKIDKKYWRLIRDTIEIQLQLEPDVETKNRKPLSKPPIDNRWEIRFGVNNCFRVFYSINYPEKEVWIHIIATKINNKLLIGNEEIEL